MHARRRTPRECNCPLTQTHARPHFCEQSTSSCSDILTSVPALHPTVPHRIAPHRIAPHRIAPHRIAPHRIAPHRIAPHPTASHRIASHPPHRIPPHRVASRRMVACRRSGERRLCQCAAAHHSLPHERDNDARGARRSTDAARGACAWHGATLTRGAAARAVRDGPRALCRSVRRERPARAAVVLVLRPVVLMRYSRELSRGAQE